MANLSKNKNALVRLLIFLHVYILLETKVDIMSVLVRHTFLLKIEPFYIVTIQNKNIWYKQIGIILYSKHPSIGLENFSNLWKVNCSFWSAYEFRDGISVSARYRQCRYCVVSDPRLTSDPGDKSGDSGASNWCRSFSFIVVYPGILFLLITN